MRSVRIALALVVCVSAVTAVASAASAHPAGTARYSMTKWHTWTQPVDVYGQTYFATPKVCVEWQVTATMHVQARRQNGDGPDRAEYWKDMKLSNVEVQAYTYRRCGEYQQVAQPVDVAQINLSGHIYGAESTGCSWNPSLSASVPFGVSVSVAPTCGRTRTAYAVSNTHQPRNSVHHVSVTQPGRAVEWKRSDDWYTTRDGNDKQFCLGFKVAYKVAIDHKHSSDQYDGSGSRESCWNVYAAD